jgi:hypothetical protein
MKTPLTRRAALAGALPAAAAITLPAMAATAVLAGASHPDAELLRLGAEFDRLHAIWLPLHAEQARLAGVFSAAVTAAETSGGKRLAWDEFAALRCETGYEPAIERSWDEALTPLDSLSEEIREIPARTLPGLAVKARLLAYDTDYSSRIDGPDAEDWDVQSFARFLGEIERMANMPAAERVALSTGGTNDA